MIDTHCHLNFGAFENDVRDVIKRAEEVGVSKFVVPGAKLDSSEKAFELSQQFGNVYAAVGFHPHHADEFSEDALKKIEELLKEKKVVAVGEIGLDLHQYKPGSSVVPPRGSQIVANALSVTPEESLSLQKDIFKLQLGLAAKYNKPCIIHCREAYDEIDNFLKNHKLRGVFHCFTGDLEHLKKVLEMGFYVSFTGNVTYDGRYDELIKIVPVDKLLLETDSPLLAPEPMRKQRNEPKNILIIAKYISEIKNVGLNELIERTNINTEGLFKISSLLKYVSFGGCSYL